MGFWYCLIFIVLFWICFALVSLVDFCEVAHKDSWPRKAEISHNTILKKLLALETFLSSSCKLFRKVLGSNLNTREFNSRELFRCFSHSSETSGAFFCETWWICFLSASRTCFSLFVLDLSRALRPCISNSNTENAMSYRYITTIALCWGRPV